jgi:Ca-activated chloride channel family protein
MDVSGAMSEILHQFHFLRPAWFLALLPAALLLAALWWRRFRQAGLERICDAELLPHLLLDQGRTATKRPLFLLAAAWLLTVTALAGPVWKQQPQPVYRLASGRVLVLDLSLSMAATDITPSRLERARYKLSDILKQSREGRTGLVVFSGEPHVVVPLTDDVATIASMLPALTLDIMPTFGDAASRALEVAASLLKRGGVKGGDILLVTDGIEDMASAMAEAGQLRHKGIHLSVLGIGSKEGAPVPDPAGSGFLTGASGSPRLSRLNATSLRELAAAGDGRYSSLTADGKDIKYLLADYGNHRLNAGQATNRHLERWQEQGVWLVLPVLLLALAGFRRGWVVVIILLLVWSPGPARARSWQGLWQRPDQQAAKLLAEGKAKQAAGLFTDPAWRAVAQHRAGDYQAAIKTGRNATGAVGQYNLGNSLARAGRLQEALAAYEKALKLDPADQDARYNQELIQKLLAQRKKKKQKGKGKQQKKSGDSSGQKQGSKGQEGKSQKKDGNKGDQSARSQDGSQDRDKQQPPKSGKAQGAAKQEQQSGRKNQGKENQEQQNLKNAQEQAAQAKQAQEPNQGKEADAARALNRNAHNKQDKKPDGKQEAAPILPPQKDQKKLKPKKDLMLEQWLRQVPDDPSGLLRRKFLLEHQRMQQRGF